MSQDSGSTDGMKMTGEFVLHERLAADCIRIGRLPLSLLLLLDDARYPWFLLVPQRAGFTEVFELPAADQQQLWRESAQLSQHMKQAFHADKMNIYRVYHKKVNQETGAIQISDPAHLVACCAEDYGAVFDGGQLGDRH